VYLLATHQEVQEAQAAANFLSIVAGERQACVCCSKSYAYPISFGSVQGRPVRIAPYGARPL